MGDHARHFATLTEAEKEAALLAEVTQLFGSPSALRGVVEKEWAADAWVQGAYSFPSLNAQPHREQLFAAVQGRVFFVGEACHPEGHSATVHGAMETAEWAMEELLKVREQ